MQTNRARCSITGGAVKSKRGNVADSPPDLKDIVQLREIRTAIAVFEKEHNEEIETW